LAAIGPGVSRGWVIGRILDPGAKCRGEDEKAPLRRGFLVRPAG
jgi:hypothetical protein